MERIATYRLQFRNGMTFARAVEIIPYLRRLGISHVYASPVFTATEGSTHGYDIIDYNAFDPVLGGEAGFERLAAAIRNSGMGLILDIVPNHMAASMENRWWRSVVAHGRNSPFADCFDIDWSRRLTLPILGRPFAEALHAGEFRLAIDPRHEDLAFRYFDQHVPISPASYGQVAARLGDLAPELDHPWDGKLGPALEELSGDLAFVEALHAAQPYELRFWKDARRDLSYRRFFEVTGLVGMRVEDAAVFDQVHRLVLSTVRSGAVDGVRVDHIDALGHPGAYLQRLRRGVGPGIWILVEKILAEGERLPVSWDEVGTTGYEFIAAAHGLLAESEGVETMRRLYARFTGETPDNAEGLRQARSLILDRNFEGEFAQLTSLATRAVGGLNGIAADALRRALREILLGFDVYRTYGEAGPLSAQDGAALARASAAARGRLPDDGTAIALLSGLLEGSHTGMSQEAEEFRNRFQQLTGPIMAKSLEDTHFYRSNGVIALNEVGSSPDPALEGVQGFHALMSRDRSAANDLHATATHDTKRGEDARARLLALAERPEAWAQAVCRWHRDNSGLRSCQGNDAQPDRPVEWLIYQALAGAVPSAESLASADGRKALAGRILPYLQKALREAKLRTDWLDPDEQYEQSVLSYAAALLDPDQSDFAADLAATLAPFLRAGGVNAITQCLAKLTIPGVPDIYHGSELLDVSLVDPDNRSPVDFERLNALLGARRPEDIEAAMIDGRFKQWMIATTLACRREDPTLFLKGAYRPVELSGPAAAHYPSYLRECNGNLAIVVLQRQSMRQPEDAALHTSVTFPTAVRGRHFRNVLSAGAFVAREQVPLPLLLADAPVALAVTSDR